MVLGLPPKSIVVAHIMGPEFLTVFLRRIDVEYHSDHVLHTTEIREEFLGNRLFLSASGNYTISLYTLGVETDHELGTIPELDQQLLGRAHISIQLRKRAAVPVCPVPPRRKLKARRSRERVWLAGKQPVEPFTKESRDERERRAVQFLTLHVLDKSFCMYRV